MTPSPIDKGWDELKQPSLFGAVQVADPIEGERRKRIAIEDVESAAHSKFLAVARAKIEELAATGREFTTDDVWLAIAPEDKPREMRALGAVIVKARRDGVIESTGRYAPSTIPECHRRPKLTWRMAA